MRNHWMDEQGRVFIYYTVENIMRDLGCGNQKVTKLLAELEKRHGLIERKKQGLCVRGVKMSAALLKAAMRKYLADIERLFTAKEL